MLSVNNVSVKDAIHVFFTVLLIKYEEHCITFRNYLFVQTASSNNQS